MAYQLLPRLIDSVRYTRSDKRIDIEVGRDRFDIEFDTLALASAAGAMLDALRAGELDLPALARRFDASLAPYSSEEFLGVLDTHALVTENQPASGAVSGRQFICEVAAHLRNELLPRYPLDELSEQFRRHAVETDTLRRWSMEYYIVTRFAERCVAGALCQAQDASLNRRLRDFFFDEVGHEKLLRRSLLAMGLSDADVDGLVPHLATDAMMAMLLRASHFDLPAFIALVGQMEGTSDESRDYIASLDASGLPAESARHQKLHEQINVDHDHGDEARLMAASIQVLARSDIERCQKAMHRFLMIRRSLTPYVLGRESRYASWRWPAVREALAEWLPHLLSDTLPIAIARVDEASSRRLVHHLVELKAVSPREIDPDRPLELLMCMVGESLWKLAYQQPEQYVATIAWLEALAQGRDNETPGPTVAAVIRSLVEQLRRNDSASTAKEGSAPWAH